MFQATTALCSTDRQLNVCTWSPNSRPRSTPSLPKQRNRDRVMRRLALVQFAAHPAPVILIIQGLQNVDRLLNTADLRKSLIDAVLSDIRAKPMKHQRR